MYLDLRTNHTLHCVLSEPLVTLVILVYSSILASSETPPDTQRRIYNQCPGVPHISCQPEGTHHVPHTIKQVYM